MSDRESLNPPKSQSRGLGHRPRGVSLGEDTQSRHNQHFNWYLAGRGTCAGDREHKETQSSLHFPSEDMVRELLLSI